jgi:NADH-quinone oxidoreductase subunit M
MAFFMLLVAGVYGVFIAVDMFLLFFFYELAIFPMYLLIAGWGWVKLREYAAMKLTLYILIGSVVALIGVIAMVLMASNFFAAEGAAVFQSAKDAGLIAETTPTFNFNMVSLTLAAENGAFDVPGYLGVDTLTFAKLWFPFIFLGFAVLAGIFPFHNWSPDGHVAAPTAVSMIHAGVLMKLGAYAAMRMGIQLLPQGAVYWFPFIIILATINVAYGSFIAMRQRDMKYLIGYSSVSHMGLVSLGFAAMTLNGFTGAGIQMVSHGVMTALFFSVVGMIYDRAHTRSMDELSGMAKVLPWTVVAFIIGGLVSMGMPGLSGFVAEYPIFLSVWDGGDLNLSGVWGLNPSNYYPYLVIPMALGIVVTAAYVMRAVHSVFFGDYDEHKWHDMKPIRAVDKITLVMFVMILIVIGVYPGIIAPIVESGVAPVIARVQEAQAALPGATQTVWDSVQTLASNIFVWLGGGA